MNGTEIRAWRSTWGLSQRDLARLLGVGQPAIVRWENDERQGVGRLVDLSIGELTMALRADRAAAYLHEAQRLLHRQQDWLRIDLFEADGPQARDAEGQPVKYFAPTATKFTPVAAIGRAWYDDPMNASMSEAHADAINAYITGLQQVTREHGVITQHADAMMHVLILRALAQGEAECRSRAARYLTRN